MPNREEDKTHRVQKDITIWLVKVMPTNMLVYKTEL